MYVNCIVKLGNGYFLKRLMCVVVIHFRRIDLIFVFKLDVYGQRTFNGNTKHFPDVVRYYYLTELPGWSEAILKCILLRFCLGYRSISKPRKKYFQGSTLQGYKQGTVTPYQGEMIDGPQEVMWFVAARMVGEQLRHSQGRSSKPQGKRHQRFNKEMDRVCGYDPLPPGYSAPTQWK